MPIAALFKSLWGIETLMFAFGLRAWAVLLDELGRVDPAAFHATEVAA